MFISAAADDCRVGVCRYARLQPAWVDPRALLPCRAGDGLVARSAALRHALRWHSVWTRRADHEGWRQTTSTGFARCVQYFCLRVSINEFNTRNKEFVSLDLRCYWLGDMQGIWPSVTPVMFTCPFILFGSEEFAVGCWRCRSRRSDPSLSEHRPVRPAVVVGSPRSSVDAACPDSRDSGRRRRVDVVESVLRWRRSWRPTMSGGDDGDISRSRHGRRSFSPELSPVDHVAWIAADRDSCVIIN